MIEKEQIPETKNMFMKFYKKRKILKKWTFYIRILKLNKILKKNLN
jgi:hypothetical protein